MIKYTLIIKGRVTQLLSWQNNSNNTQRIRIGLACGILYINLYNTAVTGRLQLLIICSSYADGNLADDKYGGLSLWVISVYMEGGCSVKMHDLGIALTLNGEWHGHDTQFNLNATKWNDNYTAPISTGHDHGHCMELELKQYTHYNSILLIGNTYNNYCLMFNQTINAINN